GAAAAGLVTVRFKTAVDTLYAANQAAITPFFAAYPQLKTLYDNYQAGAGSAQQKRATLLQQILPALIDASQQQQTLQVLSATLSIDTEFAPTLLQKAAADGTYPLHSVNGAAQPALNDFLALEQTGLSVEYFAADSIGAAAP